MKEIKTIGVLTSGGDAPGMNAAIRAVTRAAIYNGWKVMGIYRGYEGLINGDFKELTTESVSNTIQRGGTILKTARSEEFMTVEGRKKAYDNLVKFGVDALIVIGATDPLRGRRISPGNMTSRSSVCQARLTMTFTARTPQSVMTRRLTPSSSVWTRSVTRRHPTTAYSLSR